jgi:transcriptional regulator with XRE-family HTH domain
VGVKVRKVTPTEAPLADVLRSVRREVRISQKELADVSGVGESTVKGIERGEPGAKPSTLRLLARGLATDGTGHIDPDRADRYYHRLMVAAGYDPPDEPEQPAGRTADDLRRILTEMGFAPERSTIMDAFIRQLLAYHEQDQDLALAVARVSLSHREPRSNG